MPASWAWAPLGDLFGSITDGDHQPPPQVASGVPFLVIGNVNDGQIDFSGTRFVSSEYFESLAAHRKPQRGDVLYTVTGSFGIPILVDTDAPFCVQRHIAILKEPQGIGARYAVNALRTADAMKQATKVATGTAQKTVGLKQLRQIQIPVAPLPEQQRIVEAIESYFSRLDDAVATLDRVRRNLKRYRASVLQAAVEGRLVPTEAELARIGGRSYEPASVLLDRIQEERRRRWKESGKKAKYAEPVAPETVELPELPEGWCWATVDQVSHEVRYGTSSKTAESLADGVPVIRMGNIVDGELRLDDLKYLPKDHDEFPGLLLEPGDLLFNRTNSAELVGKSAVFRREPASYSFASYLIQVRLLTGAIPEYLAAFINSFSGRSWVASVAVQQVGQANVNGSKLKSCIFPLPPLPEQVRIVAEIDRLLSVLKVSEQLAATNAARCARLRQSILKWAFEGKLADQDPNDEPASELLKRIRVEQAASTPAKNNGGPRRNRRSQ